MARKMIALIKRLLFGTPVNQLAAKLALCESPMEEAFLIAAYPILSEYGELVPAASVLLPPNLRIQPTPTARRRFNQSLPARLMRRLLGGLICSVKLNLKKAVYLLDKNQTLGYNKGINIK